MKIVRATLSGSLVWALVFTAFLVAGFMPVIKDSAIQQAVIVGIFIIPFAYLGAFIYYKTGDQTNGFITGLVMVSTALVLDALITVPFVIIPQNGSYASFYTNPILWILVVENIGVNYLYWRFKLRHHL